MNRQVTEQITIRQLDLQNFARWDEFVEKSPDSTFFHKAGWQLVLEQAFGHRGHFLYAEMDSEIVGVLPLAEVKSLLFGHSLVSTPFCVYGGVVSSNDEARQALIDKACQLADELSVDYLELRNRRQERPDWPCKTLYYRFRKSISENEDENLKAIPRKQRAVVRKAIKLGLESTYDDDHERFYTAYSTSVRNLGTPVFSKKYFQVLREVFADCSDILTITHNDKLVTSVLSFYFRDEVLPYYGGGTAAARNLKGNDFMYWQLMSDCSKKGIKFFDYGRSKKGTGSFSFKKNWGFEPEPLYYEYYLVNAKEMPELNPLNPKYQLMINCWKKLPLKLSQVIGPMVSKYLG